MPDQSSAATEHAILQEITRPLEALPDDPLAYVNAEFPSALRGYDRVAVDEYVQQTRRLVAELQATRSPEAAVRRALERVGEQISGILQRAHETAEQITAQSRRESEDRLQQARNEAVEIAGAAQQRVRDLDADTDRIWLERQRIVSDAEDLAGQLLALAKTAAERFPSDAEADDGAVAVGATLPYDDARDVPTEADSTSFEAFDDDDDDDDDDEAEDEVFDDEDGDGAHLQEDAHPGSDPEPNMDKSEIERTMAFQPLEPSAKGDQPPAEAAEPPRTSRFTDDESTHVIPPASQAANRRLSD